jgi:hypothetical protein
MATLLEYSWMASDTYDSRRGNDPTVWVAPPGPPPGWDYLVERGDEASSYWHGSDLEANVYYKGSNPEDPQEIVISFRGTEFDRMDSLDLLTNVGWINPIHLLGQGKSGSELNFRV